MKESIKQELKAHILSFIEDGIIDDGNMEDWHQYAFNEDHYIIGYYNASQWLKRHELDPFEAVADLVELETSHFGESHLKPEDINSETVVNRLVYFYGLELGFYGDTVQELKEFCEE